MIPGAGFRTGLAKVDHWQRMWAWGIAGCLVGPLASCSKDNEIHQNTSLAVGSQCGEPGDPGCGVGAVCALGFCRSGCTTDAECPQGAICVGDRAPFGCSLPSEIACSSSQPCQATGLECGIDGVCRLPCEQDQDCSRNEHRCIAGSCVGEGERDYDVWAGCETGATQCAEQSFQRCNVAGPGWVEDKGCGSDMCTVPEGRCLEHVIDPVPGQLTASELSLVEDRLYWFDDVGNLQSSGIEPGTDATLAIELGADGPEMRSMNGALVGVITEPSRGSLRRVDGAELLEVEIPDGWVSPPIFPMPTTAGLFWVEGREAGTSTSGVPTLMFAGLETVGVEELGPIDANVQPDGPYCFTGDTLYFVSNSKLYAATPGIGIEGPLVPDLGSGLACRSNDVVFVTESAVLAVTLDGGQTSLVQHGFVAGPRKGHTALALLGDELLLVDASSMLVACNVVTGEVREVLSFNGTGLSENLLEANDTHVFLGTLEPGAPSSILRTGWE